ncbi:phosphatidylglycerophosphate synthase [Legionella spiritensis]|uniref:Phosphatidylglycerophosphate synthase n=2 Tax=Legionella spiritensis TaxID=452 RepID=A0A0W0Z6I1_LEGSP|nr:phosphatidylglycerophosphate synthase [Legionella spiritensis]SNV48158.1 phosphatidylglycerophosphate synthase [Legionella spiritensis]
MTVGTGLYKLVYKLLLEKRTVRINNPALSRHKQMRSLYITVSHPILKHTPNALTFLRLILIIPFLAYLYQRSYVNAFYIFLLAGVTDGIDGWLARHFNWQSLLGSFIDPLADKLLVASSFISLALIGRLPWWLVILVFLRDLTISIGVLAWFWLIQRKIDFEPTRLSKINTTLQLALVTLCLFELAYFEFSNYLVSSLIILTAATTTATYIYYVWSWGRKACEISHLPQ